MTEGNDILNEFNKPVSFYRNLLTWWMKGFIWIFLFLAVCALVSLLFASFGYKFVVSIYGLETSNPLSIVGIAVIGIFVLKGIVGFGLWNGKRWAIAVGLIDAIIGIVLCLYTMFIGPLFVSGNVFSFRLELALLIPYFIKLLNIRFLWNGKI